MGPLPYFINPHGEDAPSNIKRKIPLRVVDRYIRDFGTHVVEQP